MSKETIEKQIERLCVPIAASFELEIVQVQYHRGTSSWTLRILVDRPEGIDITDCEAFSRELSHLLDIEDPIPTNYNLEVSSPGLDRPLVQPEDFNRFAGYEITLRTRHPVEGRRNFKGKLGGLVDNMIILQVDGKQRKLEWSLVEKANLVLVLGKDISRHH